MIEASLLGSFYFFPGRSQRIDTKQRALVVIALHSLSEIFLIMILNQENTGARRNTKQLLRIFLIIRLLEFLSGKLSKYSFDE
jgi:hypothetical protein